MQFCQKSNYLKLNFFDHILKFNSVLSKGKNTDSELLTQVNFEHFHNIAINSENLLNFELYKKKSSTFIFWLMKCSLGVLWIVNFVTVNVESTFFEVNKDRQIPNHSWNESF